MDKQSIRDQVIASRKAMLPTERTVANRAITDAVLAHPTVQAARTICVYISAPEEVDTHRLIDALFKQGKAVIVPKVVEDRLMLMPIDSWTDVRPGAFGLLEPVGSQFINAKEAQLFLVPGVAFDREGNRLGWGKGFYDKLLEKVSAPKIGLAYDIQILSRLPHTPYDIPMNTLITEKEVFDMSHAGSPQG